MSKLNAIFTIIAISVLPTFLAGCVAISDDIARVAARQGSKAGDDVARQVPKKGAAIVPPLSSNVNQELLDKCSRQVGKSAVVETWKQVNSSGSQVSENYLLGVARDAIQKCTVGKVGDEILDELANLAVSDFKQEYPQAVN
jgi:hypothetical protein